MILVTGAAGKTGRAVIAALVADGHDVRALVRRDAQRDIATALGARAHVGDMSDPAVLRAALDGAAQAYHICPNMHPDEPAIGQALVRAATDTHTRVVLHSVFRPDIRAMPHHWHKHQVEQTLAASGLPHAVLRPAPYMDNIPGQCRDGAFRVPYPLDTRISLVALADVAAATARVLADPDHRATTTLCAPGAPTQREIAAALGLPAVEVPLDDWARDARAAGLPDWSIATLTAMFRHYAAEGYVGDPAPLERLLGRPATTLADYARRPPAT